MEEKTTVYELQELIDNDVNGDTVQEATLFFPAPTMATIKSVKKLAQLFMRTVTGATKDQQVSQEQVQSYKESVTEDDEGMDAKTVEMLLLQGSIDFEVFVDTWKSFLKTSAYFDEGFKNQVKSGHIERMNPDDFVQSMCLYISKNCIPSSS